jgi:hypothetical protein
MNDALYTSEWLTIIDGPSRIHSAVTIMDIIDVIIEPIRQLDEDAVALFRRVQCCLFLRFDSTTARHGHGDQRLAIK